MSEFFQLAGMEQQIRQLADIRGIATALARTGIPENEVNRVARAVGASLTPSSFLNSMGDVMLANYAPNRMAETLEWYRSQSGRRVTRADVEFASPAKVQAFMSSLQQGRTEVVEPGRLAIIERISEAFDFPRVQSVVVRGVMRGMATQINPHLPPNERLTEEKLDELMRQQSVQNTGLKRLFVARLAFAYKTVTDDDLRAYADFLESDAGRWNTDCLMRGAAAAAESIAQNMAAEIIRAIAQSPRFRR